MKNRQSKLRSRLYQLMIICLGPVLIVVVFMFITMQRFTVNYDTIVDDITKANEYNMSFKEDMDYMMYTIVVSSQRAGELMDINSPYKLMESARRDFTELFNKSEEDYPRSQIDRILRSLDTLYDRVDEIVDDSYETGTYDKNMSRLDNNIRIITELIQEQIQNYISYQTTKLDSLRSTVKGDLQTSIMLIIVAIIGAIVLALWYSYRTMKQIVDPVNDLCRIAEAVGQGNLDARVSLKSDAVDELAILGESFNDMVGQIDSLIGDVKNEQEKLRIIELQLLQEQINPHFLYNTLDTITWLSEMGDNEHVIMMVNSLSDFFRTSLSNGRAIVKVKDEKKHIESYLTIQQFRYQDILDYSIDFDDDIGEYNIPKLTLQPLVENALYHGIKNKRGKGQITVTGSSAGSNIIFMVKDNGMGVPPAILTEIQKMINGEEYVIEAGHGFGLKNVLQRIQLTFGENYGVEISSEIGEGTLIKVIIPKES